MGGCFDKENDMAWVLSIATTTIFRDERQQRERGRFAGGSTMRAARLSLQRISKEMEWLYTNLLSHNYREAGGSGAARPEAA